MSNKDLQVVTPDDLGRGLVKDNIKRKYEVDLSDLVDGTTIRYEGGVLKGQAVKGGGLDCAAIGALKKTRMDKSITVLGKKGGECVQVAVLDSIFQDVGVGISADKYSGYVNDKFNVKITVTNTGEGTNENTTLRITKPLLGAYTIENQSHRSTGAGSVVKVSATEYTIKKLERGGTVTVTFDVISKSHGTYQFGASVDPDTALDINAGNHRASITLSVNTKVDPTYQATRDCPAIVVTDMDTQKVLTNGVYKEMTYNIYENPLTNRRFKLDGASTVVITHSPPMFYKVFLVGGGGGGSLPPKIISAPNYRDLVPESTPNPFYDFNPPSSRAEFDQNSQILTLSLKEGDNVTVAMRPSDKSCRWQYFCIGVASSINYSRNCFINHTRADGIDGVEVVEFNTLSSNELGKLRREPTNLGFTTIDTNALISDATNSITYNTTFTSEHKNIAVINSLTLNVNRGKDYSIPLTVPCASREYQSLGRVAFSNSGNNVTITVSRDATPTDSVRIRDITVNIV